MISNGSIFQYPSHQSPREKLPGRRDRLKGQKLRRRILDPLPIHRSQSPRRPDHRSARQSLSTSQANLLLSLALVLTRPAAIQHDLARLHSTHRSWQPLLRWRRRRIGPRYRMSLRWSCSNLMSYLPLCRKASFSRNGDLRFVTAVGIRPLPLCHNGVSGKRGGIRPAPPRTIFHYGHSEKFRQSPCIFPRIVSQVNRFPQIGDRETERESELRFNLTTGRETGPVQTAFSRGRRSSILPDYLSLSQDPAEESLPHLSLRKRYAAIPRCDLCASESPGTGSFEPCRHRTLTSLPHVF